MKLLWSNLSLGGLYTDANANDDGDNDDDDNDNNDTWWTEHDCIGSLPNEPKIRVYSIPSDLTSDANNIAQICQLKCKRMLWGPGQF